MNLGNILGLFVLVALVAPPTARAGHDHPAGKPDQVSVAKAGGGASAAAAQVVNLTVTSEGIEPSNVVVTKGKPVKLVVTRKIENTCVTEIVLKDFGVTEALPLNKSVALTVTPSKAGSYKITCGMGMPVGTLKVE